MSEDKKHTPLPWSCPYNDSDIFDNNEKVIFSPGGDFGTFNSPDPYSGKSMGEEDRKFMLNAVNNYYELLDLVKQERQAILDLGEHQDLAMKARVALLDKSIAKAEGKHHDQ